MVAVARTSPSASLERGLITHSNFSGLLKKRRRSSIKTFLKKKKNGAEHARKDARGVRAGRLDDAAVAHGLLDAESGEHARDYDEYERVGHPASGADATAKAERIVDCGGHAWVDVGVCEALRLE